MKKNLTTLLALVGVFLFLGAGNAWATTVYFKGGGGTVNGTALNSNDPTISNSVSVNDQDNIVRFEISGTTAWFKMSSAVGNWDTFNGNGFNLWGSDNDGYRITNNDLGTGKTVYWGDAKNIYMPSADTYMCTLYLGTKNQSNTSLVVRKVETYPSTIYLLGTINGKEWDRTGISASKGTGNKYTWSNVTVDNNNGGYGFFSFTTLNGGDDWNNINSGIRYGANSENELLSTDAAQNNRTVKKFDYSNVTSTYAWKVPAGKYNVTLDLQNNKVSLEEVTEAIYVLGIGDGLNWQLPGKEVKGTGGKYTFEVTNLWQFRFSTSKTTSDWNGTFNPNSYVPNSDFTRSGVVAGNAIAWKQSDKNIQMPFLGTYEITIDVNAGTIKAVAKDGDPGPKTHWVLHGEFEKDNVYTDYTLARQTSSENIWQGIFTTKGSGNFTVYKTEDAETGYTPKADIHYKSTAQLTDASNTAKKAMTFVDAAGGNNTYNLEADAMYLFTLDDSGTTPKLYVQKVVSLYLYGHINDGSWDRGNYAKLDWDDTEKKFMNYNVDISGQWNKRDTELEPTRVLWDPTRKQNETTKKWDGDAISYLAFYPVVNENPNFDRAGSLVWKFGSRDQDNNIDYDNNSSKPNKNTNFEIKENTDVATFWQEELTSNNFMISSGTYKVSFDPKTGNARFEKAEPLTARTLEWYFGDDDNKANAGATRLDILETGKDGTPHYVHNFIYGDNEVDVVQVGASGNPKHNAARQAAYKVSYKGDYKTKYNARRRSKAPEEYTAVTDDDVTYEDANGQLFKNYSNGTYSNPTDDPGLYTVIGSDNYDDNHLLRLNQMGDYYIVASVDGDLQNEYTGLSKYSEIKPASLLAAVTTSTLTGEFTPTNTYNNSNEETQPWSMNKNSFESFLTIHGTALTYKDLVITFEPTSSVDLTTQPTTRPDDFDEYVWGQMTGIQAQHYNVDGYYDANVLSAAASQALGGQLNGGDYEVNIEQQFPCSGVYTVSASINPDSDLADTYTLEVAPATVVIYPTILNVYPTIEVTVNETSKAITATWDGSHSSSYSIFDAYAAGKGEAGTVIENDAEAKAVTYGSLEYQATQVPSAYRTGLTFPGTYVQNFWMLDNALFYTPGVYLAANTSSAASSKGSSGNQDALGAKRRANENFARLDLSDLAQANKTADMTVSYDVDVVLTKNGATTPRINGVSVEAFKISPSTGVPTGIENVTVGEEAEGEAVYYNLQGVKVANPEHGIYVKVVNGKATKVVL